VIRVVFSHIHLLSFACSLPHTVRGVIIDSKDVEIQGMLGKGGFGVVHLATLHGEQVAVKQLLTIDMDNVKTFRFECFLMKNLRHPNIVKLIGVCWDDKMLGCCLEYVSNGTLNDWLLKTTKKEGDIGEVGGGETDKVDFTWKGSLLRIATECAAGVQYCHHARYFNEEENKWRDCIIHRDLKPDNMLLTELFTLKLTDFGLARVSFAFGQSETISYRNYI
jgi:serine/threonine protein kinase